MAPVIQVTSVYYPESDGKPLGETDEHRDEMVRQIEVLRHYYRGQQVYVSGNLLLYYVQGDPKKFVVPDLFVVKDTDPERRRTYKLWIERKPPEVVIETTSRKTKKKDTTEKPALYARLGVQEYFLFDPTQDYLDPPLQGHRLRRGKYRQMSLDAQESLVSEELGLRLKIGHRQLLFYRLSDGRRLLAADELLARESEARRLAEEGRQVAEAEVARLREELRRRGGR
jgi:Uma2 family endonuclease